MFRYYYKPLYDYVCSLVSHPVPLYSESRIDVELFVIPILKSVTGIAKHTSVQFQRKQFFVKANVVSVFAIAMPIDDSFIQ